MKTKLHCQKLQNKLQTGGAPRNVLQRGATDDFGVADSFNAFDFGVFCE